MTHRCVQTLSKNIRSDENWYYMVVSYKIYQIIRLHFTNTHYIRII